MNLLVFVEKFMPPRMGSSKDGEWGMSSVEYGEWGVGLPFRESSLRGGHCISIWNDDG